MERSIEKNRDDLVALCQRFQVRSLEIFGSAAAGSFEPEASDLDFLVTFEEMEPAEYAEVYFGLLEALEDLFQRPIDLVVPSAISNPYFLQGISKTRNLLYEA